MKELLIACSQIPVDIGYIRKLLETNRYSPAQLAEVLLKHMEDNCAFEAQDFYSATGRFPRKDEIHSGFLYELTKIFLEYGMDPNYINGESCILLSLQHVAFDYVTADTARLLLEHGADPNLKINGVPIFEDMDFDIVFDAREFFAGEEPIPPENARHFDARVHIWFVMMGYGGLIKGGRLPVTMREGLSIEIMKQHERFDFSVGLNPEASFGWELLIRDRATGEVVAWL